MPIDFKMWLAEQKQESTWALNQKMKIGSINMILSAKSDQGSYVDDLMAMLRHAKAFQGSDGDDIISLAS